MDPDYGPFPDYETALNWLERRGSFVKDSWIVSTFTPQEVARRVKVERMKNSTRVYVRGYDTSLPDTQIKDAIAKHFSSCGEIIRLDSGPLGATQYDPDRFVVMNILGEDAKEKAEKLHGSVIEGCKLNVTTPPTTGITLKDLEGERGERIRRSSRGGYTLPESVRRELDLKEQARIARHEEEMKRSSLKRKEKEALCECEEETKPSSQKKLSLVKKQKEAPKCF